MPADVSPQPFVKWAGGKRRLARLITQAMPVRFGDYFEPFVGGGSVFFALSDTGRLDGKGVTLSDLNAELMAAYLALRADPRQVIRLLAEHKRRHCKGYFYHVRGSGVVAGKGVMARRAARFIYLNKTCFNGLYRVNRSGQFNAPLGGYVRPSIFDAGNLRAVSMRLAGVDLRVRSFEKTAPARGDVVYCDPPYDGCFVGYTPAGFGDDEQRLLAHKATEWWRGGAHVVVSNADTALIREIYAGWEFREVAGNRQIAASADARGVKKELLITRAQTALL